MPQLPDALLVDTVEFAESRSGTPPLLEEWAFDFDTMQFKVDENGLPYLVQRNEALKIWLYWAVTTEKARWRANSRWYGAEIERMIGMPVTTAIKNSELKRTIREAVEQCEYVRGVNRIDAALEDGEVTVTVSVHSTYNNEVVSVRVEV